MKATKQQRVVADSQQQSLSADEIAVSLDSALPYSPRFPNLDKRFTPSPRDYSPKRGELVNLHREVCRLLASGMKQSAVAAELNITANFVSMIARSQLGKRQIEILHRAKDIKTVEVSKKYIEMQGAAADVIETIMLSGSKEENRLKAALHVAAIGGHSPIQRKVEAHGIFDFKDIDEISGRIETVKQEEGISDAEFTEDK